MVRMTWRDRMILKRTEALGKSDVSGWRNILIPEEQNSVLEQQLADFSEEVVVFNRTGDGDI
jgi:hypothetical protein